MMTDKMEVIGLLTFGGDRVNGQEISGFDFVVPSSTVMEFIKAAGVANEYGHADKAYREGLELFWNEQYSSAIPKFEEVKRLFPEHSEVNRLIQVSQQSIAEGKDKSSVPWTWIIIILVVLFLIVAVIVIGVTVFLIVGGGANPKRQQEAWQENLVHTRRARLHQVQPRPCLRLIGHHRHRLPLRRLRLRPEAAQVRRYLGNESASPTGHGSILPRSICRVLSRYFQKETQGRLATAPLHSSQAC